MTAAGRGKPLHILMLAAENGALPGGKIGGIGDVIRDAPRALGALGHTVSVVTPGYGHFSVLPGAHRTGTVKTRFRGQTETLTLHRMPAGSEEPGVRCFALEHPLFSVGGPGRIYVDDGPERPFATDASRFALFCAASAGAVADGVIEQPDVVHLHDWHAALFALIARGDPAFRSLASLPLVYTIHNLALQGIRPLRGDDSSLLSWFPGMLPVPAPAIDPRYGNCLNPVRAAISLCDHVHTVSPRYATEICSTGTGMDAGLGPDLRSARDSGRLSGILNGCDYSAPPSAAPPYRDILALAQRVVLRWTGESLQASGAHVLALHRIGELLRRGPAPPTALLTSVGRLTDQKMGLLCARMPDGRQCLEHVLDALGGEGLCVILGSGDPALELTLGRIAGDRRNLLFLRGYSDDLAEALYAGGNLFLMPSTFEPCGISQMLAMRAGQPCLVNAVGGLADTVADGITGFVFAADGDTQGEAALLQRLDTALHCLERKPGDYRKIREACAAQRFTWETSAIAYVDRLYRPLLIPADTDDRHSAGDTPPGAAP